MRKRKGHRSGGAPTDYTLPCYSSYTDVCIECTSEKCKGTECCAQIRKNFIQEIEAANGKAVMINGLPAYTLDDGRMFWLGKVHETGGRRCEMRSATGWDVDTGEKITVCTNGLYFAAGRSINTARYWLKDEIALNPRKAITLAANM